MTACASDHAKRRLLIQREAKPLRPPLAPELKYWGVDEETRLWTATEAMLEQKQLPPPFWAFAWPGGQVLARFLLDEPNRVRDRRILALASGAALEAIAALRGGAASVVANDIDPFACAAAELNVELNDCGIDDGRFVVDGSDLLDGSDAAESRLAEADVILVGDAFYERSLSQRLLRALEYGLRHGADIFIGDAGRGGPETSDFLKSCHEIAAFITPTPPELEGVAERQARVLLRSPTPMR